MPEQLTFANYSPLEHGPSGIYRIGANPEHELGVVQEMAEAFGHELSDVPEEANLGNLIGLVGPHKELQNNISHVKEVLGEGEEALHTAQDWIERTGLMVPAERSYMGGDTGPQMHHGLAVITGGVRNWMYRRAELAINRLPGWGWDVRLIAGNRKMSTAEGPDVSEGMTEAGYMRDVVIPKFPSTGFDTHLTEVESGVGDVVMAAGAASLAETVDLTDQGLSMILVSNAGTWVQNAGQFRRAIRNIKPSFDQDGSQFSVMSDGFPVGTGKEPTSTHQNPFTALGIIVRNAQELVRHL